MIRVSTGRTSPVGTGDAQPQHLPAMHRLRYTQIVLNATWLANWTELILLRRTPGATRKKKSIFAGSEFGCVRLAQCAEHALLCRACQEA